MITRRLFGTDSIELFRNLLWLRGDVGYEPLSIPFFLLLKSIQEGVKVFVACLENLLPCRSHILNNWVSRHDPNSPTIPESPPVFQHFGH
jgi:hypothetical protein